MPHKQKKCLKSMLKDIGLLNRTAMAAGNAGKFDTAFKNINQALDLTHKLKKRLMSRFGVF